MSVDRRETIKIENVYSRKERGAKNRINIGFTLIAVELSGGRH
jgi:hypothetical protein